MNAIAYRPSLRRDASAYRIAATAATYFAGASGLALLAVWKLPGPSLAQLLPLSFSAGFSIAVSMVCLWIAVSTARRHGDRNHPGTASERAWANGFLVASALMVVGIYLAAVVLPMLQA